MQEQFCHRWKGRTTWISAHHSLLVSSNTDFLNFCSFSSD